MATNLKMPTPVTGTGTELSRGRPLPSLPLSPAPQQYAELSAAIAHVCMAPALTAIHRSITVIFLLNAFRSNPARSTVAVMMTPLSRAWAVMTVRNCSVSVSFSCPACNSSRVTSSFVGLLDSQCTCTPDTLPPPARATLICSVSTSATATVSCQPAVVSIASARAGALGNSSLQAVIRAASARLRLLCRNQSGSPPSHGHQGRACALNGRTARRGLPLAVTTSISVPWFGYARGHAARTRRAVAKIQPPAVDGTVRGCHTTCRSVSSAYGPELVAAEYLDGYRAVGARPVVPELTSPVGAPAHRELCLGDDATGVVPAGGDQREDQ